MIKTDENQIAGEMPIVGNSYPTATDFREDDLGTMWK
jgi:hypothetical protein